jgi:hypothetical protein
VTRLERFTIALSPSVQILLSRTAALAWRLIFRFVLQGIEVQNLLIDTMHGRQRYYIVDSFGATSLIHLRRRKRRASHNCFVDVTTIFVENVGSVDFNITDFDFTFQDVTTDLLVGSEANLTLAPGTDYKTTETRSIERCANTMYCAEMLVNGTSKDTGAICDDIEELKFDITEARYSPRKLPVRHRVAPQ